MSYSTAKAHTGNKSAKVVGASGSNRTLSQTVSGLKKGTYILSAYVNTSEATAFASTGGIYMGSGEKIRHTGESGEWMRVSSTATVTSDGGSVTLTVNVNGVTGSVYIDDVQLEPSAGTSITAPSNVNLLDNGTMSASRTWSLTNAAYSSGTLKMNAGATTTSYATQTVTVNQPGTQTYMLSGWAKAESGPLDAADRFALKATIKYTDNTTETFTDTFCKDFTGWQYLALPIVPTQRTKTVSVITVYLNYNYNLNTAYFDKIALVKELAASYKYNDNGDLVSVAQTDSNTQSFSYSGSDLTQNVSMGSGTFNYAYDGKHNVTGASHDTTSTSVTYNGAGNVTNTTVTSSTLSGKSMTSSATYTNSNNLAATATDARGYTTTYDYTGNIYKQLGTPYSVKDAKGTTVVTARTATNGRVSQSYISNVASLNYTYSGGMVSSIARGSYITSGGTKYTQTYNMTYDAFDNLTKVDVGGTALATYTYAGQNGNLTKTTYGNGDYVNYTYDSLERVSQTSYNDRGSVSYIYNGLGGLGKVSDAETGRSYLYNYDSLGRLIGMNEYNSANIVQSFYTDYDNANRVSSIKYRVSPTWNNVLGTARAYAYSYSATDGNLDYITTPGGPITYTYDGFNRLSTKKVKNTSSSVIVDTSLSYLNGATTSNTTGLVQTITNKTGSGGAINSYTYSYDQLGNITRITGSSDRTYTYDAQGQMLTEKIGSTTYTYTYDSAGNIRSKTGGGVSKTWSYPTSGWLDKLTSYNDGTTTHSISYDNSGNPTKWRGLSSLTWETGRRLMAATTNDNKNLTFTYDVDGLRLTKKVGSTEHKYIWQGDRLVSEAWGNEYIEFFYDESGMPSSFYYYNSSSTGNNGYYYYVTNLQGDIVGIRNSSGSSVATYEYDAWGKLISTAPASGSIGEKNPLRYRGYYYDSETGLYYLQSRYYDPEVCRFINADTLTCTGQGFLGFNMFAYCSNSPIIFRDTYGNASEDSITPINDNGGGYRFVGIGLQAEVSVGGYECGFEIIVYCDASVCEGSEPVVEFYTYEGAYATLDDILGSGSFAKLTGKLIGAITTNEAEGFKNKALLVALQTAIFKDTGISGSVVAIFGNDDFKTAIDYAGPFKSTSVTINHVKATYSSCPTCISIAIGASTDKWGVSYGQTNYTLQS